MAKGIYPYGKPWEQANFRITSLVAIAEMVGGGGKLHIKRVIKRLLQ